MKKNISINIGGIIFHIEEDGFDKLRAYLDSVNQYFSTFEDSKEIIDDIENRIAEIFLSKLSDGKQVISNEDVMELMSTMGTTQDFDATIETESEGQTQKDSHQQKEKTTQEEASGADSEPSTGSRKLYRDERRKVLGGVAAGIAHYFGIDTIWIRLLFIALFVNVFFGGLSGAVFLTYLILWIVVPGNKALDDDDQNVKKLFRDGESRALGGVCSGLASYFGTDTTVVRLLFVLSIFLGGAGIIVYIILWIITPEAKTITEKMQMEGEPVTLSNIEENVKKNLNEEEGEESALAKVLLFPFRVIATVIKAISSALGPVAVALVEIVRIFVGIIITIVGFSIMISLIVAFLVVLGWDSGYWADYVYFGHIPTEVFVRSVSAWSVVSAFLIAFIPALSITLLGLYVLLKRSVIKAYFIWALFGFWILGLIGSAFFIPSIARDFRTDSSVRDQQTFQMTSGTPTLRLNDAIDLGSYEAVDLRLRGHADSTFRLETRTTARGANRNAARENAEAVEYVVTQLGDDFYFDSNVSFPGDASFRFQEVDATFYIPEGKVFRMDRDLEEILTNTLYLNGYRSYQMEDNDWVFNSGGLECLTCPSERGSRRSSSRSRYEESSRESASIGSDRDWRRIRGEEVSFQYEDFEAVKVSSHFKVFVVEGDEYEVRLRGDEDDLDDVSIRDRNNTLEIKRRNRDWGWWDKGDWPDEIGIYIVMPKLEALELSGACDGQIRGFEDYDMELSVQGASELEARIRPDYLELRMNGASKIELDGSAKKIEANINGASKLDAIDFRSETGDIDINGASKANVFVTEELWVDADGISTVSYKGDPKLYADKNGFSTVKRY